MRHQIGLKLVFYYAFNPRECFHQIERHSLKTGRATTAFFDGLASSYGHLKFLYRLKQAKASHNKRENQGIASSQQGTQQHT